MTAMEITLLIIGVVIFCLSFILKDKQTGAAALDEEVLRGEVRKITDMELDSMKLKVKEATEGSIEYAMEKSERALEKITNEKIMAVSEYSNTIIEEINKSHKEVMFLYDMLTDKQTDLKNTVRKAEATAKEVGDAEKKAARSATVRKKKNSSSGKNKEDKKENAEVNGAAKEEVKDKDPDAGETATAIENNNSRIIELHKSGRSNVEIAKELNLGVGEVSLVIELFER